MWVTWLSVLAVVVGVRVMADESKYRLPAGPLPSHYDVFLAYDIDPVQKFPYYGLVKIQMSSNVSVSAVRLHAQDLDVAAEGVEVRDGAGDGVPVEAVRPVPDYSQLEVRLRRPLDPHTPYQLVVPFSGRLHAGLEGAYVSSYEDIASGQKEYLVATQFEAVAARKAFPCFDEPALKATFTIHLAHPADYTAISNMPLHNRTDRNLMAPYWTWDTMAKRFGTTSRELSKSWVWESFSESVPMSTYLVAWVISKFEHVTSPKGLSHVNFRTWARKDAISQTEYASVVGPKVLSFYERWFNVSFPLPKQDMVAIPDFAAGAMENWGLVTYRETALLHDPARSSLVDKERVAEVVAHELAHQWFGNLVTMDWWSDLWLNEGFATYMAILGVDAVEPSWDVRVSQVAEHMQSVLALDALRSSHPISVTVHDPKMINEIFDTISYLKGAMLIHMMNMFLGETIFKEGINRYLVAHSYKNAAQSRLWSALSASAEGSPRLPPRADVALVMDTWTLQTGYPLLTVSRNYSARTAAVSQRRFLALDEEGATDTGAAWWVPLSVLTKPQREKDGSPALSWLAPTEGLEVGKELTLDADPTEWVLMNADMVAPLRVTYDLHNWELLAAALADPARYQQIPVLSRVQLLDDSFALSKVARLPYNTTLRVARYLRHESEVVPLSAGLSALGYVDRMLARDRDYGTVREFLRAVVAPQYRAAGGLAARPQQNKELKMQTLTATWACRVGAGDCEEAALALFERWMSRSEPVPRDLRPVVYCTAVRRGGPDHWEFLNQQRLRSNVAAEMVTMLRALGCSRQVWILKRYLEWTVSDGGEVRTQDVATVLAAIASNPDGFAVVHEFVLTRIADLHRRFAGQKRRIGGIIKSLLRQYTTQRELDQFLEWRDQNSEYLEDNKLTVQQAIEAAQINIRWTRDYKDTVVQIMRAH